MERGDAICLESNHVLFTKWLDNRPVHMKLKIFLAVDPKHKVKQKFQGSSVKIAICCLIAIQKYNKYIGEVDVMDQRKVSYQFDHRSKI